MNQTREAIEQAAADHLVELLDQPDAFRVAAIERWIDESPAHAVAFAQAERARAASVRLKAVQDVGGKRGSLGLPGTGFSPARRRLIAGGGVAVAACALGLVGFGVSQGSRRYATRVGQFQNVQLADGSRVRLNTDTRLDVAIRGGKRELSMSRGEAYFDVAHDPSRPFDVAVPGGSVRAIGTAFNIRVRPAFVELTVTDGIVRVHTEGGPMRLVAAGKTAVLQRRSIVTSPIDPGTVAERLAWREQAIVFNGASVADAVAEFNRYRPSPIVIGDDRVGKMRVGGHFRTNESAAFLDALAQTLPVRVVKGADESVVLVRRE